jgi:hypothetical protein
MESREEGGVDPRRLRIAAATCKAQVSSSFETLACGRLLRMRSSSPHGEEPGNAARLEPGDHGTCGLSFETRARARSSEAENVSFWHAEFCIFNGPEDIGRESLAESPPVWRVNWPTSANCGNQAIPMPAAFLGRPLTRMVLFMLRPAPWRARRRSASCCERPRTTADGCGP